MGEISSTTPATIFSCCVTAEAGSTNPRWNFFSFDNHNGMNLSISAPNSGHYHMYNTAEATAQKVLLLQT